MCIKLKGSGMSPGQVHAFLTKAGKASGTWGFRNGSQYNVRMDSIPTVWKRYSSNRGVLMVDSFWEKGKQFIPIEGNVLRIGILFNESIEFSVITTDASPVVKPYHHRMPYLLSEKGAEDFLNGEYPIGLPYDQIKLVA